MKFENPTIQLLLDKYRSIWSLIYADTLINWDTETYMPEMGVKSRGKVLADINCLVQKIILEKEFTDLIIASEKEKSLNDFEKRAIYRLNKSVKQYQLLPAEFIKEWSELIAQASTIWAKAKRENNYDIFEPYLKKIFELTRKRAKYLDPTKDVYDSVFDQYEDGMTSIELDKYFSELKTFLNNIDLKKVASKSKIDLSQDKYSKVKMRKLNNKVLDYLGQDKKRFRIDTSMHPFSLFLSPDDIRITTSYPDYDFTCSLFPTIHEFGHGLFASNVDKNLEGTPLWPETSYALHESLSRYWENFIGRSRGFVKYFYKDFIKLNKVYSSYKVDDFYSYFNKVEPSLIRVEADEITYHYHIIIRYEVEKALLNNEITTKEAPKLWNKLYKKYLGIEPKNYSEGILQDVHWAFGSIGYFPTYSLGSTLSAIWDKKMKKDIGTDFQTLEVSEIKNINKWFKNKIHVYGGAYNLEEISLKAGDQKFSSKPWQEYIKTKYLQ